MTHLKNIHVCGIVTNIQVFQISFVNDSLTSACIWNSNLAGIVIYNFFQVLKTVDRGL